MIKSWKYILKLRSKPHSTCSGIYDKISSWFFSWDFSNARQGILIFPDFFSWILNTQSRFCEKINLNREIHFSLSRWIAFWQKVFNQTIFQFSCFFDDNCLSMNKGIFPSTPGLIFQLLCGFEFFDRRIKSDIFWLTSLHIF